jgi:uncharacterized protein YecE (DUF72 family)
MRLAAGTSGFSYKEWKGLFYPAGLPQREWLHFYAERLPAVEINNTFYRLPKRSVLEGWAAQVPAGFAFAIKASQRITHWKRLAGCAEELAVLLGATEALGPKLGALLFQCPPDLKADLPRLEAFLAALPAGTPSAFEFRHPSWRADPVLDALRARGAAWVVADTDEAPQEQLIATAPLVYVRLRRAAYGDAELAAWRRRLEASGAERALVFFKHEDAAVGPRLAAQLLG